MGKKKVEVQPAATNSALLNFMLTKNHSKAYLLPYITLINVDFGQKH